MTWPKKRSLWLLLFMPQWTKGPLGRQTGTEANISTSVDSERDRGETKKDDYMFNEENGNPFTFSPS